MVVEFGGKLIGVPANLYVPRLDDCATSILVKSPLCALCPSSELLNYHQCLWEDGGKNCSHGESPGEWMEYAVVVLIKEGDPPLTVMVE